MTLSAPRDSVPRNLDRRLGFTLVELLVVIAIIGILVAMLLPAVQAAREAARRMQCSNNLKQMGLALLNYHDTRRCFPYSRGWWHQNAQATGWGWSAFLLPYLENAGLYDRLDFNAPYNYPDASTNTQNNLMMKTFEPTYQCPAAEPNQLVTCCTFLLSLGPYHVAQANYSAIATHTQDIFAKLPIPENSHTGVMYLNSATRIRDIADGTSQTFLVGETITYPDDVHFNSNHYCPNRQCYVGHFWAAENAITTYYGINSHTNIWDMPASGVESAHPGGAQFVFADGHARYLSQDISQSTLNALTTREGEEDVSGEY